MAIVRTVRTVDSKGRVHIPKPVLESVGINPGDLVYFETTKVGGIVIRKHKENE